MAGTSLIERVHDSMELATRTWWSPFWVSGDISVALVDLRPDAGREREALTWLDSVERARWEEYRPTPRRRFILCRAALRVILCGELGCRNEELSFAACGVREALCPGSGAAGRRQLQRQPQQPARADCLSIVRGRTSGV